MEFEDLYYKMQYSVEIILTEQRFIKYIRNDIEGLFDKICYPFDWNVIDDIDFGHYDDYITANFLICTSNQTKHTKVLKGLKIHLYDYFPNATVNTYTTRYKNDKIDYHIGLVIRLPSTWEDVQKRKDKISNILLD
jgi:hypothetical protein